MLAVENVGKIAISEKFNCIPREVQVVNTIPSVVMENNNLLIEKLKKLYEKKYDWQNLYTDKACQMKYFEAQMSLAQKLSLPVSIHDRDAHGDVFDIIRSFPDVKGVMHSFSSSPEMARQYVKMGWYISFSGSVTFKTAEKLRHAVTAVPIDRVLCETDAPYLAPVPLRGKRNDSLKMRHTVEKLAEIYGISFEEMAEICLNNALSLFGIVK